MKVYATFAGHEFVADIAEDLIVDWKLVDPFAASEGAPRKHKKHKKHQYAKVCPICSRSCKGANGLGIHMAKCRKTPLQNKEKVASFLDYQKREPQMRF